MSADKVWVFAPAFVLVTVLAHVAPSSSFPVIVDLTLLLAYTPILYNRGQYLEHGASLIGSLTVGQAIVRWNLGSTTIQDSPNQGRFALLALSFIEACIVAFCSIFSHATVRRLTWTCPALVFPAVWTTVWWAISYWPLGRLLNWSPALGLSAYTWMGPIFGPAGFDWVVAAWATVVYHFGTDWYMNKDNHTSDMAERPRRTKRQTFQHRYVQTLAAALVLLTILSLGFESAWQGRHPPLSPSDLANTPLQVGCVLPHPERNRGHKLTLDDYIAESQTMQSNAALLLWPESAVTFKNESEKSAAFAKIRKLVPGSYVGVPFEESFYSDDQVLRRSGLAVISQWSEDFEYFKQHLVPLVESFPLTASSTPPSIGSFDLRMPKYRNKTEWGGKTREITFTASICLDNAFPSIFTGLQARPSIILAPARTWDTTVAWMMWQEAVARATEIDTQVLWCDGGEHGFSGVGGAFIHEPMQQGPGSWTRTIAVQQGYGKKTVYGRFNLTMLVINWGVLSVFVLFEVGSRYGIVLPLERASQWVSRPFGRKNRVERDLLGPWEEENGVS